VYVLNSKYSCTEPIKIYKMRFPRGALDIVKFCILDNITSDELDLLFSEELIFVDTNTGATLQFPEYKISGRVDLRYGCKTKIILERQVQKGEDNIQKSSK